MRFTSAGSHAQKGLEPNAYFYVLEIDEGDGFEPSFLPRAFERFSAELERRGVAADWRVLSAERAPVLPHSLEAVNYGWIALQAHSLFQTVVENAGHHGPLFRFGRFALNERSEGHRAKSRGGALRI